MDWLEHVWPNIVTGVIMLGLTAYTNWRIRKREKIAEVKATEAAERTKKLEEQAAIEKALREATQEGVKALLRDRLVGAYEKITAPERGYAPIYERENIEELFKQYRKLGGNGTISHLMDEIEDLPIRADQV